MTGITVIGACGRMGKLIIGNILDYNDLTLTGALESNNHPDLDKDAGTVSGHGECGVNVTSDIRKVMNTTDIFIDFSTGQVIENARLAVANNKGIVIGVTALSSNDKTTLAKLADEEQGKIVFAPNMSIGVNLLFHVTKMVSEILNKNYEVEIIEMHHNQKKDAPSGTAEKLAEIIAETRHLDLEKDARYGRFGIAGPRDKNEIGIHVLRGGDVVGEHTVIFAAEGERVELTHKASSRQTFAKGALEAARFLDNAKPGLYDMQDVLGIK